MVVAGGLDTFEIYIWQTQTGRMIDVISSHAGPISHVSFGSNGNLLTSSWDKSVKVWDLFRRNSKEEEENLRHLYEVLCAVYSPDCKEIATATLDGSLHFWKEGEIVGTIDGRKDLLVGRAITDRTSAKTKSLSAHFESICYSSDGASLLASGSSKYVCIYSTASHTLLKRFEVATNYLMGGMKTFLNSKKMTEAGNIDLIDDESDNSDLEERLDISLPGVKSGDFAERRTPPVVRNRSIQFSPTNRSWAVASTEGVLVYSVDDSVTFDPFDLDVDIKPSSIKLLIDQKHYLDALIVAFRLNQPGHLQIAYEAVPPTDIKLISRQLPIIYLDRFLNLISSLLEGGIESGSSNLKSADMQLRRSPHLEFHLRWFYWIFSHHGAALKQQSASFLTTFRNATKAISYWRDDLTRMYEFLPPLSYK
jgi:periodic tryptophan protein 2